MADPLDLLAGDASLDVTQPVAGADLLADPNAPGPFARGVKSGVAGVKSSLYGFGALAARGATNALPAVAAPITTGLEQAALENVAAQNEIAAQGAITYEDVVADPSRAGEFIKYAAGSVVPSLATMVAGGVVGAGLGALRAGAMTAAARAAAVKSGALLGAVGSDFAVEAGSIFPEALETGVENPALRSVAGGAGAAAIDFLTIPAAVRALLPAGKAATRAAGVGGALKSSALGAVTAGGKVAGAEGIQELTQTFIERAAAGQDISSPEAISEYINATLVGAIGGGMIGGPVGGVRGALAPVASPAPIAADPATPVPDSGTSVPELGTPAPENIIPPTPEAVFADLTAQHAAATQQAADHTALLGTLQQAQREGEAKIAALAAEAKLEPGKRRVKAEIFAEKKDMTAQVKEVKVKIEEVGGQLNATRTTLGTLTPQLEAAQKALPVPPLPEGTVPDLVAPEITPRAAPVISDTIADPNLPPPTPAEQTDRAVKGVHALFREQGMPLTTTEESLATPPQTPREVALAKVEQRQPRQSVPQASPAQMQAIEANAMSVIEPLAKTMAEAKTKTPEAQTKVAAKLAKTMRAVVQEAAKQGSIEAAQQYVTDNLPNALKGHGVSADATDMAKAVNAGVGLARTQFSKGASTRITKAQAAQAAEMSPELDELRQRFAEYEAEEAAFWPDTESPSGANAFSGRRADATAEWDMAQQTVRNDPKYQEAVSNKNAVAKRIAKMKAEIAARIYEDARGNQSRAALTQDEFDRLPEPAQFAAVDAYNRVMRAKGTALRQQIAQLIGNRPELKIMTFSAEPGGPIGSYTRVGPLRAVIAMALNAKEGLSVADHEGYHFAEDWLLTGGEKHVVANALKPGRPLFDQLKARLQQYDRANATSLTDEVMAIPAEARAYAFEFWRRGEFKADGTLAKAWAKLKQFFERIVNFVKGQGFQSIEDVFVALDRGQMAERDMVAPESRGTSLNSVGADYLQSPAFKKWFGNSKVVDKDGKPLVVYHSGMFDETQDAVPAINGEGFHFGTKTAAETRDTGKRIDDFIKDITLEQVENENGDLRWYWSADGLDSYDVIGGEGFVTENAAQLSAEDFAKDQEFSDVDPMPMTKAYLSIQNPKRVKDQGENWTAAVAKAKAEGHDGIVYRNEFEDKGKDSYIVFSPTQIKSVNNTGAFDPNNPDIRFSAAASKAFHGSPHRFDKFSLDHMGKGEGAQAYGWGLYFAGRREVAEYYKEKLSEVSLTLNGKPISAAVWATGSTPEVVADAFASGRLVDALRYSKGADGKAIAAEAERLADEAEKDARMYNDPAASRREALIAARLREFAVAAGAGEMAVAKGQLYEVEIPDDGEYLLWDKPLSEQPEKAKTAVEGAVTATTLKEVLAGKSIDELLYWVDRFDRNNSFAEWIAEEGVTSADEVRDAVIESYGDADMADYLGNAKFTGDRTGESIYRELSSKRGTDEAASKYLNSLGVAGIKYLDGASRNRPLREIKKEFLAELPEDADFAEVTDLLGTGKFSPANEDVIKALQADDWLGFDYPAQALSAALGGELSGFDASQALKDAVVAAQDGSTYNYVVFNADTVSITQTFFSRGAVEKSNRMANGELEAMQMGEQWARHIEQADIPKDIWARAFGVAKDDIVGGLGRWWTNTMSTPNYISAASAGFKNVYQAFNTYSRYRKILSEQLVRERLPGWYKASDADRKAAFDVMLKRTVGKFSASSQELADLLTPLTREQRLLYDQATGMIAGVLQRQFDSQKETRMRQLTSPGAYDKWLAHRQEQMNDLLDQGYVPLRRYGDYSVAVYMETPDGKRVKASLEFFGSLSAANAAAITYAKEIERSGLALKAEVGQRSKNERDTGVSLEQFLGTLRRQGIDISQAERERLVVAMTNADSLVRTQMMRREGLAGYSTDGMRVLHEFGVNTTSEIAYARFAPVLDAALDGAEVVADVNSVTSEPVIQIGESFGRREDGVANSLWERDGPMSGFYKDRANAMADTTLVPDRHSEWATKLRTASVMYFIGGSLSGAAVNTLSIPMVLVPQLSVHTDYLNASMTSLKAWKDAWQHYNILRDMDRMKNPDADTNARLDAAGITKEMRAAIVAAADHIFDTEIHQMLGISQGSLYSKSRNVQRAAEAWMLPFRVAEQTNRLASFMAAYRVASTGEGVNGRGKLSGQELFRFASETVDATQNNYNVNNRPGIMNNPIGALMFQFKSFPLFIIEAAALMYKQSPKSAVYMLLGLTAMAGVQGLPFAEEILNLVDVISQRLFGSPFNSRRAMRNTIKSFSDAVGVVDLSDAVMRGLVNEITGVGVATRVSGGLLPGTRIGAADATEGRVLSEMAGAPYSMVHDAMSNVGGFVEGVAKGDWMKAADAMRAGGPIAVRNAVKGAEQLSSGYASDSKGRKVADVSTLDGLLQLTGLSSAAVAKMNDMQSIIIQTKAFHTQVSQDVQNRLVKAYRDGDHERVQETLDFAAKWNEQNPAMPILPNPSATRRAIALAGMPLNRREQALLGRRLGGAFADVTDQMGD